MARKHPHRVHVCLWPRVVDVHNRLHGARLLPGQVDVRLLRRFARLHAVPRAAHLVRGHQHLRDTTRVGLRVQVVPQRRTRQRVGGVPVVARPGHMCWPVHDALVHIDQDRPRAAASREQQEVRLCLELGSWVWPVDNFNVGQGRQLTTDCGRMVVVVDVHAVHAQFAVIRDPVR